MKKIIFSSGSVNFLKSTPFHKVWSLIAWKRWSRWYWLACAYEYKCQTEMLCIQLLPIFNSGFLSDCPSLIMAFAALSCNVGAWGIWACSPFLAFPLQWCEWGYSNTFVRECCNVIWWCSHFPQTVWHFNLLQQAG